MNNKEKFKTLVSKGTTSTIAKNKERIRNRARLRESQDIALKVLAKLDEKSWTQRKLAEEMDVSPQQITKIVGGKENLTLGTQVKLQEILDVPILASYYEHIIEQIVSSFKIEDTMKYKVPEPSATSEGESFSVIKNKKQVKYNEFDSFLEAV